MPEFGRRRDLMREFGFEADSPAAPAADVFKAGSFDSHGFDREADALMFR